MIDTLEIVFVTILVIVIVITIITGLRNRWR